MVVEQFKVTILLHFLHVDHSDRCGEERHVICREELCIQVMYGLGDIRMCTYVDTSVCYVATHYITEMASFTAHSTGTTIA